MAKVLHHKYWVWLLLAVPSVEYISEFIWPDRYYPEMMKNSGILSMQLLVVSLCITPLSSLLKRLESAKPLALWLIKNRRYVGVASFAYAMIHTALYVRQTFDFELIWIEALDFPLGSGWISLLVLLPLALTSNAWSVKKLGKRWKPLQRLAYLAAIAGFVHWLLFDFFIDNAMQWIVPLMIAKLVQIALRISAVRQTETIGAIPS